MLAAKAFIELLRPGSGNAKRVFFVIKRFDLGHILTFCTPAHAFYYYMMFHNPTFVLICAYIASTILLRRKHCKQGRRSELAALDEPTILDRDDVIVAHCHDVEAVPAAKTVVEMIRPLMGKFFSLFSAIAASYAFRALFFGTWTDSFQNNVMHDYASALPQPQPPSIPITK